MIRKLLRRLFRRKNPVYETMTRYTFLGYTIRVWREEPEYSSGPDKEILDAIEAYLKTKQWSSGGLAHRIGSMPRVAAIEFLNSAGNGALFYPDWK